MRELVYLSEQKLQHMFVDSDGSRTPSVEATLGVPGFSVTASTAPSTAVPDSPADVARKLDKAIRLLDRKYRAVDFATPELPRPNQWVSFDVPMGWGMGREATATSSGAIALFVGTTSNGTDGSERATGLLLCGSAHHFRHRAVAVSRPGSDMDSVYQYLADLEADAREETGSAADLPAGGAPAGRDLDTYVVHHAFRSLSERWPAGRRGRLRGHARVLLTADDPNRPARLVVATPLYVEMPPVPRAARRFHLWHRRDVPSAP